jgi:hypothetical protein
MLGVFIIVSLLRSNGSLTSPTRSHPPPGLVESRLERSLDFLNRSVMANTPCFLRHAASLYFCHNRVNS